MIARLRLYLALPFIRARQFCDLAGLSHGSRFFEVIGGQIAGPYYRRTRGKPAQEAARIARLDALTGRDR